MGEPLTGVLLLCSVKDKMHFKLCTLMEITALFILHTLGSLSKVKIDISRSHTPLEMDVLTIRRW